MKNMKGFLSIGLLILMLSLLLLAMGVQKTVLNWQRVMQEQFYMKKAKLLWRSVSELGVAYWETVPMIEEFEFNIRWQDNDCRRCQEILIRDNRLCFCRSETKKGIIVIVEDDVIEKGILPRPISSIMAIPSK